MLRGMGLAIYLPLSQTLLSTSASSNSIESSNGYQKGRRNPGTGEGGTIHQNGVYQFWIPHVTVFLPSIQAANNRSASTANLWWLSSALFATPFFKVIAPVSVGNSHRCYEQPVCPFIFPSHELFYIHIPFKLD